MAKSREQASRENGAKGGRKARAEPTAEPGGGVADNEGGDDVAPTATNVQWSDGNGEAAAAEPPEAADDMTDERNAAALTEEGAPEASATSATSAPLPLDLAEEEETRAAHTREVARVEAVLDARDASSQAGFAPLDPEDAMAIRMMASFQKMDKGEEEEEKEYVAKWQAAWEEERERDKEREAAWDREIERERERERRIEAAWEREMQRERERERLTEAAWEREMARMQEREREREREREHFRQSVRVRVREVQERLAHDAGTGRLW